jgi:hypothetical protein
MREGGISFFIFIRKKQIHKNLKLVGKEILPRKRDGGCKELVKAYQSL